MLEKAIDVKEMVAEARRQQILQGAAQIFAEKGFHKATTKQIAKAAGVSEGTIYNYFNNKRDLLFALLKTVAMRPVKEIIAQSPDDPEVLLKQLLYERFELVQTQGQLIAPIVAEVFTDEDLRIELHQQFIAPTASLLEGYLQTQIDAGRFRAVQPVHVVARILVGAMAFNTVFKLIGLDERDKDLAPADMIDEIIELFLHGITKS